MTTLGPHLLGRVAPPDDAHVRAFPLTVPTVSNVEVDQGDTPRCVGY
jgi:hypothetical protein